MTVLLKIGPREKTNQEPPESTITSFVKTIQNGPYSDPSSRNYGRMSDQFFVAWVKRSFMRDYFLRPGTDDFLEKEPVGQYVITRGMVAQIKASTELRMTAQEKEFSLWLLEWIEKFKSQPDLIIEIR